MSLSLLPYPSKTLVNCYYGYVYIATAIIKIFNFVTEKEILDYVYRKKLSVLCIGYNWKGREKTFPMVFELFLYYM